MRAKPATQVKWFQGFMVSGFRVSGFQGFIQIGVGVGIGIAIDTASPPLGGEKSGVHGIYD